MNVESVAIVIHKLNTTGRAFDTSASLSVTAHDIIHHDNRSTLGPGRVFSTSDHEALMTTLADQLTASTEILSNTVLATNQETLMWYRPAGKATVNIDGTELRVPLPTLVFLCQRGNLYVMAAAGNGRPTSDTALRLCGLPNVSSEGAWCTGGNKLPEQPKQAHMESLERMFLESPFTHWWGTAPEGADADMLGWFETLSKKPRFPMRALKDADCTLGQWFTRISRNRH